MDELRPVAAHGIPPNRYRSYLLRLWREAPAATWRRQVQCVGTGQERRFAGLAEVFEFLVADARGDGETRGRGDGEIGGCREETRGRGGAEIE